jgi:mannose-1-phosphate guanylyltransferase
MKAFLLAAGLGTRLRPLTDSLPKILVPVLGVAMLDRLVAGLARQGVTEIALNTHHRAPDVERHLAGARLPPGVGVRRFHEPRLLGTGGALVNAAEFWSGPLLLWNGDILADVDLAALGRAHGAGGALATLVVSGRAASSYVLADGDGVLCGIDSPQRGGRRLVRASGGEAARRAYHGVAMLAPALLKAIARPGAFDLIDALLEVAAQGGRIDTWPAGDAFWATTGSAAELQALEHALARQPELLARFTPWRDGPP